MHRVVAIDDITLDVDVGFSHLLDVTDDGEMPELEDDVWHALLHPDQLSSAVWGAVIGYLALWSVYQVFKLLTGKEGMGFGDFKLLAALGAWFGVAALLPIILLSSICGAVIGITLQLLKLTERGRPIPFGPFLAAAGIVLLFIGPSTLVSYILPASGA